MKTCYKCKVEKDDSEFHKRPNGKLQSYCISCWKQWQKDHYKSNKESYLKNNESRRQAKLKYIRDFKESNPCTDCGKHYHHYIMDFDHLDDKEFAIGNSSNNQSLDKIKNEISKCEVVCANCHRQRTWNRSHEIGVTVA